MRISMLFKILYVFSVTLQHTYIQRS